MSNLAELGFNASTVEPNEGFDVIPAGEYDAVIVGSEVKATSSGEGKMLKLELQILSGQFQNRKLFDNLNLWNKSDKAVQIARGTLSAICRAINVLTPSDSTELHNKPLRVKIKIEKSAEYGDQNRIASYKPRHVAPPPAPVAHAPAPQPVAAGASPWGN
jgi:hypothetical protein